MSRPMTKATTNAMLDRIRTTSDAGTPVSASSRIRRTAIGLLAVLAGVLVIVGHSAAALAAPKAGAHLTDAALAHASKSGAVVFWIFALALVAGSVFVITRRNLVTAVMGLVGTFFTLAALYAILYASFLAAIQVLVYAGAIMVLFVFVIMILNKPEAEPWSTTGVPGKVITVGVLAYLLLRLVQVLWAVAAPDSAMAAPAGDFGSTRAIGDVLFKSYLFPFEAVSLVLLIAVVGAIAVARPHHRRPNALENSGPGGGAAGTAA